MVVALIEALRASGPRTIELMVDADNPAAQALYRGLGFHPRQWQMVKAE
jgi:ribosomal protein S18 acetylase RimI-like enzyme